MEHDISKTIIGIRQFKGWSQERLAQEIGVSFSTINSWERGRRKPQPFLERAIMKLAKQCTKLRELSRQCSDNCHKGDA